MHNAKDTDYLVPYGITRFYRAGSGWEKRVESILEKFIPIAVPAGISFRQLMTDISAIT